MSTVIKIFIGSLSFVLGFLLIILSIDDVSRIGLPNSYFGIVFGVIIGGSYAIFGLNLVMTSISKIEMDADKVMNKTSKFVDLFSKQIIKTSMKALLGSFWIYFLPPLIFIIKTILSSFGVVFYQEKLGIFIDVLYLFFIEIIIYFILKIINKK